ncbi:MAG: MgtC/SapB family protein [Elusimicrobia bacterium]|nr:MgtC/SapB family protein [Elusimicrobiota bacterium]
MLDHFAPQDVALKLVLSLGIGLLIGLEREWSNKDAGARTFPITALLGTLSSLLSIPFSIAATAGVLILVAFLNIRRLLIDRTLEITTSAALILTVVLGVLVGQGHLFTPVAAAILTTILLAWKTELTQFANRLQPEEIRSAVLLGLLSFVIYPVLPHRFVDPWRLLDPREVWVTMIVIASIGFVNYVLLRLFSARGFHYTAVLGGLVNSTATIAELAATLGDAEGRAEGMLVSASLLTIFAMFVRNLVLLALLSPASASSAFFPLAAMAATVAALVRFQPPTAGPAPELKLASPISLRRLIVFGVLFFAIEAAGTLAERFLGRFGLYATSLIGGCFSSASATAAAANLAARGQVSPGTAGIAAVLTSFVSALMNLPLIFRVPAGRKIRGRLFAYTMVVLAVGLAALVVEKFI